jgi:hypothetical protein
MKVFKVNLNGSYCGGMLIIANDHEPQAYAIAEDYVHDSGELVDDIFIEEMPGVESETAGIIAEHIWSE